jgi:DUF1365 family protein
MTLRSAIYRGSVAHERVRPKRHRLRYAVYSLLLDLDELAELDRRFRLFGYNRFAPISFHDHDHGSTTGEPLRPWVEDRLREAGLEPDGGPISLLCYPRVFGYVFNPLSVFFCYGQTGGLKAILYEVCNTYSERHTYVIPVGDSGARVVRQACRKALYVSPFIGMETDYHFRVAPPDEGVSIAIRQVDADGLLLAACFKGAREELADRTIVQVLFRFPMLTAKVIAAIHWHALRMWMKGFRVYPHRPAAARVKTSTGCTGPSPFERQGS